MNVGRNSKIWRLSIVEKEPNVKKVKEDVCREESEEHRNYNKKQHGQKDGKKRKRKSNEDE